MEIPTWSRKRTKADPSSGGVVTCIMNNKTSCLVTIHEHLHHKQQGTHTWRQTQDTLYRADDSANHPDSNRRLFVPASMKDREKSDGGDGRSWIRPYKFVNADRTQNRGRNISKRSPKTWNELQSDFIFTRNWRKNIVHFILFFLMLKKSHFLRLNRTSWNPVLCQ